MHSWMKASEFLCGLGHLFGISFNSLGGNHTPWLCALFGYTGHGMGLEAVQAMAFFDLSLSV